MVCAGDWEGCGWLLEKSSYYCYCTESLKKNPIPFPLETSSSAKIPFFISFNENSASKLIKHDV
jgi:hypothetical protein